MYAGSSGSNYGVNKNSPGNGNGKWQGLWPSVGHARNARLINTRAGGNNRDVVFCMNQLGGVGKISTMFATTANGVQQPCQGSEIVDNNPLPTWAEIINSLNAYYNRYTNSIPAPLLHMYDSYFEHFEPTIDSNNDGHIDEREYNSWRLASGNSNNSHCDIPDASTRSTWYIDTSTLNDNSWSGWTPSEPWLANNNIWSVTINLTLKAIDGSNQQKIQFLLTSDRIGGSDNFRTSLERVDAAPTSQLNANMCRGLVGEASSICTGGVCPPPTFNMSVSEHDNGDALRRGNPYGSLGLIQIDNHESRPRCIEWWGVPKAISVGKPTSVGYASIKMSIKKIGDDSGFSMKDLLFYADILCGRDQIDPGQSKSDNPDYACSRHACGLTQLFSIGFQFLPDDVSDMDENYRRTWDIRNSGGEMSGGWEPLYKDRWTDDMCVFQSSHNSFVGIPRILKEYYDKGGQVGRDVVLADGTRSGKFRPFAPCLKIQQKDGKSKIGEDYTDYTSNTMTKYPDAVNSYLNGNIGNGVASIFGSDPAYIFNILWKNADYQHIHSGFSCNMETDPNTGKKRIICCQNCCRNPIPGDPHASDPGTRPIISNWFD